LTAKVRNIQFLRELTIALNPISLGEDLDIEAVPDASQRNPSGTGGDVRPEDPSP
jgi:hypothetical protein